MTEILSKQERRRFAEYCLQQQQDFAAIAKQMAQLPNLPKEMIEINRKKAVAYMLVRQDLELVEEG